jgi:hypothetical protein
MPIIAILFVAALVVAGMRGGIMNLVLAAGCLISGAFFGLLLASWLGACFGWAFFLFCVLLAVLMLYGGCREN